MSSSSAVELAQLIEILESHSLLEDAVLKRHRTGLVSRYHLLTNHPRNVEVFEQDHAPEKTYATRLQILRDAKLTIDCTGKPIEFLPYANVREHLLAHPELSLKMQQGFTNIQPLTFGSSFEAYFAALEEALVQYDKMQRTKHRGLRATDGTPLHLSKTDTPLWIYDPYRTCDADGSLVYHPKEYHSDLARHQGKTKAELLQENPANAFQIHLVEPLKDILRRGHGQTIGNRPQLEAGEEVQAYLDRIGESPYDQEQGFTPELELTRILTHLHETEGAVLDDFQSGSACYCPAGWFPSHGYVPRVNFSRVAGRLDVGGDHPDHPDAAVGARASVRVRRKS